jgi:hypothetical protein
MEKHKLLSLVRKTGKSFTNKNPTGVYRDILKDNHYETLSHVLNANDLVMYSLLVPRFNVGSDIDEDYDRIENNMFTIELVEIYTSDPEVECPECGGHGSENCDNCDGTGEVECGVCDGSGEEDCRYCGGSGMDEDAGEECDMCEGDGKQTCEHCNGHTSESCNYCGGDGETGCYTCDSTGKVESSDSSEIMYTDFVSWSGRWKMYFANVKHHEQIDTEDANNFYNNNQTLNIREHYEISEEYEGYENGDQILFHMNEKPELTNRDSNGVVRI